MTDDSSQEFYVWSDLMSDFMYEMNRSQWPFSMLDIFKNSVLTWKLVS